MADTSDDTFWSTLGARGGAPATQPPPATAAAPGVTATQPAAGSDDAFWSTLGTKGGTTGSNIDPITGLPFQYASSGGKGPVAESTGRPIREDQVPGPVVQGAGSMATDPEQRRRIIAKQLFPQMSDADAQSRIFTGVNGRLAAVGPDGQAFYVDPAPYAPDINQPRSLIPDNPAARVGTYAGPALPAVGAVAGGAVTAPTSLVVGPIGAGAGAAAGDVARQTIARQLDPGVPSTTPGGQPMPVPYNWLQTGKEAVGAAAGQVLGAGVVRGLTPNPLGASALDLAAVQEAQAQQRIAGAYARAKAQGVQLTPGQASGMPSVLNLEDVYASGTAGPRGANIAQTFYQQQRQQLTDAFDKMTSNVSSASDKTDAALQFQQAAEDAQRIVRQQGNLAARPAYQAAQGGGQVMSPDLAQLMNAPAVKTAMDSARGEYQNLYRKPAPDTPDFALWDLTKRKLDDAYSVQKRAGENTAATSIDSLRSDLLTHLDAAYPTYGVAREAAAPGQRLSAQLQDTLNISPGSVGNEKARAIVGPVFESNNPRAISTAKDAFTQAGRADEWNAGTRAYVQDLFDKASQSQDGLNPSMLLRQVWGDPNKRAAIQAAMDPQAFAGLEKFIGTVQDVAQSRGVNSLTAPRQAGANVLAEAAGNTAGIKAVGALKGLSVMRLADAPGRAADAIQAWMTRRNVNRIGEYLFSPDGLKYLQNMGRTPTGSGAIAATARFLGQQAGLAASQRPANSDQPNLLQAAQ